MPPQEHLPSSPPRSPFSPLGPRSPGKRKSRGHEARAGGWLWEGFLLGETEARGSSGAANPCPNPLWGEKVEFGGLQPRPERKPFCPSARHEVAPPPAPSQSRLGKSNTGSSENPQNSLKTPNCSSHASPQPQHCHHGCRKHPEGGHCHSTTCLLGEPQISNPTPGLPGDPQNLPICLFHRLSPPERLGAREPEPERGAGAAGGAQIPSGGVGGGFAGVLGAEMFLGAGPSLPAAG